jgi:TP901 family phage tail tape measure protein
MPEEASGFQLGSAFVQVDPDAESFEEQLEEQLGALSYVVRIPVVPDTSGLQESVDEAAADAKASIVLPVTADPAGLKESVDAASADSGAVITVPMAADPADLAADADAAADTAATSAGTSFADKFSSVASQMSLFEPDDSVMAAEGGTAGQTAGVSFGEQFGGAAAAAADGLGVEILPGARVAGAEAGAGLGEAFSAAAMAAVSATAEGWAALSGLAPAAATEGTEAGSAAGASFSDAFTAGAGRLQAALGSVVEDAVSATSAAWGAIPVAAEDAVQAAVSKTADMWGAIIPPAETAGTEAGEAAGGGFMSRLASMLSGVTSMFSGMIPGAAAEGEEAGEAAGAGFASRFAAMAKGATSSLSGLIPGMTAEGEEGGEAAGAGFASRFKSVVMGDISPMEALMGAGFVAVAATMASKFQSAMEMVHTQAGVAQSAIGSLSGSVLTLSGQVGVSPDSLAQVLYHVESSFQSVGITGQKAMDLVKIAAEGAKTGGADVVDVVNALDGVMVSGIGGIHNYGQAMGALNAIVGSGDMKMQDLADAMGTGIMAVAKSFGQNIYQVGAALATLGDNNIRGAKAATDLRMAWQAIQQPLSTAGDALHHLGLTSKQLGDEMTQHGLTAALQMFVDHLKASKVPVDQWGDYMTEIFGKKAGVGISVLTDQLSRMEGKLPDIKKGAGDFASAWAATQATTSQKLKELESSFETLMIKIGSGLLPAVDSLMTFITKSLPGIEAFGTHIAHLVAPFVSLFFTGLEAILKLLLGPMKDVTIAVAGLGAAFLIMDALNPWVAIIAGLIILVGAIVKYHKQIWDAIKETWDKVSAFFKDIAKDIVKTFDGIKKDITSGFDAWWKSHGAELEEVWKAAWKVVSDVFKETWDAVVVIAKAAWDVVGPLIKIGLAEIEAIWKIAWGAISETFKTVWDVISAVVKVAVATVTAAVKIAWDVVVGIFNVFLDLVTGHWSKAWTDIQDMATQVWNAISGYLSSVWSTISDLAIQVWNNISGFFTTTLNAIEGFFKTAWDTVKSDAVTGFDDVRTAIAHIWDEIVSDVEGFIKTIEQKISAIGGSITSLPGKVLGDIGIHLARGGVLAGYAPGHDSVRAMLSPGEGVLVPEAVRAIGPANINAINAHFSGGRSRGGDGAYAGGGVVPDPYSGLIRHYAGGGIADGLSPYAAGAAAGQQYSAGSGTMRGGGDGSGLNATFNFYGTQFPTPEQQQAMMSRLALLAGQM